MESIGKMFNGAFAKILCSFRLNCFLSCYAKYCICLNIVFRFSDDSIRLHIGLKFSNPKQEKWVG